MSLEVAPIHDSSVSRTSFALPSGVRVIYMHRSRLADEFMSVCMYVCPHPHRTRGRNFNFVSF